jgi:aspartate aminotransferase
VDAVTLCGGTPVHVPLTPDFHFDFDRLEAAISNRTRLMFVSSPGNPTGRVLRVDEIRRLAELATAHDFLLVLDEAYHRLVYGGVDFLSICQVDEVRSRAILLNSFSKTYAMTGWRVGYMVADAPLIKDMVTFHKATTICPNVPAQLACAAAAMGPQDCVDAMRREYERRKILVEARLADIPSLATPPCDGAFYVFPRFSHPLTSPQMTDHLFGRGILVRSGTEFGAGGQGHFRIAFCKSIETLEEGMTRLKAALAEV